MDEKPTRLIRVAEVKNLVGLGKTTIYEKSKVDDFPRPVLLGVSARWVESEIEAWIKARIATRDAAAAFCLQRIPLQK